ncbi:MAG: ROK family protein [Pseudorhodoplanes sp.]
MRIGIDLGGTKIEAIALADDGAVRLRRRVPTPAGDYRATLLAIRDLVEAVETELLRSATVGVATPGAISRHTGLMKNANSTVLNGKPLDRDLTEVLRREIRLENDANCFALSEATDGAAARADVVFGVILGTGVGGGLVVGKRLLPGANRIAGEWGHNPLPWPRDDERPGPICYCGKSGCVETFLSGPGFARDYRAEGGDASEAAAIAERARTGDRCAAASLAKYKDRLARSLATIVNVIDPDAIVLGGGLSNVAALYSDLPELIRRYAFSDAIDTPVLRPIHGDSSGVRGAAWLWEKD